MPKVFQLVSRSSGGSHRCLCSRLEPTLTLIPKSTMDLDGQISSPGESAKSNSSSHCSIVAKPIHLLLMAIDHPRVLPPLEDLIIPGLSKLIPKIHQKFWLTTWLVSGNPSKQVVYRWWLIGTSMYLASGILEGKKQQELSVSLEDMV